MITQPDNKATNIIDILDLGVSPFKTVWDLQKEFVKKRQTGQINDTLIQSGFIIPIKNTFI